jgi:hypothetical protein
MIEVHMQLCMNGYQQSRITITAENLRLTVKVNSHAPRPAVDLSLPEQLYQHQAVRAACLQ